jgi:acyl carrier protein
LERIAFLARIEQIIDAEPGSLTGGEVLKDLGGWDSLSTVQFQAFLDEDFHIVVSPERIDQCKTMQDLMSLADVPAGKE